MPEKRCRRTSAPAPIAPTTSATSQYSESRAELDYDRLIGDRVDESLWAALFDGHFRLAVRCDQCGRWLTDGRSKRVHRGPRCAAKTAAAVVQ